MNREILLKSGYKEFKPTLNRISANNAFQKRVRDNVGTKYFINIYEYDSSIYDFNGNTYEISLQSNKTYNGKEFTVNTEIFGLSEFDNESKTYKNKFSIEEIESIIEKHWNVNEFNYYEKD